jgi:hypothetical protein
MSSTNYIYGDTAGSVLGFSECWSNEVFAQHTFGAVWHYFSVSV